jgi:hypothetical protein
MSAAFPLLGSRRKIGLFDFYYSSTMNLIAVTAAGSPTMSSSSLNEEESSDNHSRTPVRSSETITTSKSPRTRKRPRCDVFQNLKEFIHAHGGFVHPMVEMLEDRSLVVTASIDKGTTIWELDVITAPETGNANDDMPENSHLHPEFYHPLPDLQLARFVASRPSHMAAYWNSLPVDIVLPRMWPNETLDQLLTGSPLLRHIREAKKGVAADFQKLQLQQQWRAVPVPVPSNNEKDNNKGEAFKEEQNTRIVDSVSEFSYAMAAVTSRAYSMSIESSNGGGTNRTSSIGMVPFLDLCNHFRGAGNFSKKNLTYRFVPSSGCNKDKNHFEKEQQARSTITTPTTAGPAAGSTIRTSSTVRAIVQAAQDIPRGDTLRATYGAQGNAQLLLNYGFCIPQNIEPDGSSNDTLEFIVGDNDEGCNNEEAGGTTAASGATDQSIFLRTGPKSYTFLCFCKALESFYPMPQQENAVTTEEIKDKAEKMLDMEEFLNQCDAEEELQNGDDDEDEIGDEDDIDFGSSLDPSRALVTMTTSQGSTTQANAPRRDESNLEVHALKAFQGKIEQLASGYSIFSTSDNPGNNHMQAVDWNELLYAADDAKRYSAILVHSELRILYFYWHSIQRIKAKLVSFATENESTLVAGSTSPDSTHTATTIPGPTTTPLDTLFLSPDDSNLLGAQVDELVSAFIQIRHPGLCRSLEMV